MTGVGGLNGKAVASIVVAIAAIPFVLLCGIGLMFSIAAIGLALLALSEIPAEDRRDRSLAVLGFVLGCAGAIFGILVVAAVFD